MKAKRFYHSLRFKVALGLVFPLLATLSVFSYLQYANRRRVPMQNLDVSALSMVILTDSWLSWAATACSGRPDPSS